MNGDTLDALIHGFYFAVFAGVVSGAGIGDWLVGLICSGIAFVGFGIAPVIYEEGRRHGRG